MVSGAEIELAARDAILLIPAPLPVPGRSNARSYFGGLPLMPVAAEWPRKNVGSRSRALTFVAQIALDEVPRLPGSELPASGTLCVFLDLTKEWLDPDDSTVVFFEQPIATCIEHRHPLPFADVSTGPWFWLKPGELVSYEHHKFPIEFLQFRSYADYAAGRGDHVAQSATSGQRWTFEVESEDWPFAWGVVEHTARAVLRCVELADEAGEDLAEDIRDALADASAWLERSRAHDPFESLDSTANAEFRARCYVWRPSVARLVPRQAQTRARGLDALLAESVRLVACLSNDRRGNLDVIPPRIRTLVERAWEARAREEIGRRGGGASLGLNQMLGFGEAVQSTPFDHMEDVLLLQIKADQLVSWWPDVDSSGVVQVWISPDRLADKRFDRVTVNFDCT